MTVTLKLKPELEAGLAALAQTRGMTVEEYVLAVVETAVLQNGKPLPPDERADAFEAWSANHRPTPPLSDHAASRDSFYEDRKR